MRKGLEQVPYFQYRGYAGSLNYAPHCRSYWGVVLNISDVITYSGANRSIAEKNFERAVDEYLESQCGDSLQQ